MDLEYRHAFAEIQAIKGGTGGIINIGAGPVWSVRILPPIIAAFRRQQPKVKVKLRSGVIDTLVPALLGGELDLICSSLDFPAHPEFVKEQLVELQHVLIARAEHPLAGHREITAKQLLDYPWLALVNDYIGTSRVNSFFAANELQPPRIGVETTSISAALNLLREDDFILNIPTMMLPYAEWFGVQRLDGPRHALGRARRDRLSRNQIADAGSQRILRAGAGSVRRRQAKPAPRRRQRAGLIVRRMRHHHSLIH